MRYLYALVVPGGLILLAAAAFLRWAPPETVAALLRFFPYAVLAAGVLLGWRFHRTSVIFVLLALALAEQALLRSSSFGGQGAGDAVLVVFQGAALLLPLNLMAFSIVGDRGSLAGRFGFGFGVLASQVLTVAILAGWAAPGARTLLERAFLPEWLIGWTAVAHPGLVSFALAAVFLAVRCLLYRRPLDNGLLWALVASLLALRASGATAVAQAGQVLTYYFSTAGLIL
ncbi:MAG TPA: hypothetical protein VJ085_02510, partial [Candidatus Acidoferrales bacterium]|nr:hypothetical protein [Candidatus Acidoferrales bacterium]